MLKVILGIIFPPYGIYLIVRYLFLSLFKSFFIGSGEKYSTCPNCNERNGIDDIIDTKTISSKHEHERVNGKKDERYKKNDLVDKTEYTYKCKKCGNEFKSVKDEKRGSTSGILGQFVDLGNSSRELGESNREYERKYPFDKLFGIKYGGTNLDVGISDEERLSLVRPIWEEEYLNLQSEIEKMKNDLSYVLEMNKEIDVKQKYEYELEGEWYSVSRLKDLIDGTFPNPQNELLVRKTYDYFYRFRNQKYDKDYLKYLNHYFKEEYSNRYYELELERVKIFVDTHKIIFGENYLKSLSREIWLGMTEKELCQLKGNPDHKIEKVSRGKKREEYFYGEYKNRQGNISYKFRVVLIDGKVDGWNDITN